MKRLPLLALLLAAACSRVFEPAAPDAAASGPAYELELAYGQTGYLVLSSQGEKGAEVYGLRLANAYFFPETPKADWQVFWGDQPARYGLGPKGYDLDDDGGFVVRVGKDPFIVYAKKDGLSVARVPHKRGQGAEETVLLRVRSGPDGAPLLDYGPKGSAIDKPAATVPAEGFKPARVRFRLPAKDLM